jgi:signal transduction histidine kinase
MNIYEKKSRWKLLLMLAAVVIVTVSLWYTNKLATTIADQERQKVELIANAYKKLSTTSIDADVGYMYDVITSNESVPIILTDDQGTIIGSRNLDSTRIDKPGYLESELESMKEEKPAIEIEITEGLRQFIYYKDSYLLTQLKYYPFVQFGIIGVFLLIAYLAFSTARKAEQNQVWVGMAKETAHQLGTPISSLNAWLELLRTKATEPDTLNYLTEIENDIERLELVTERFSKIGSAPDLKDTLIIEDLNKIVDYIKRRASEKITFSVTGDSTATARINTSLFAWVLENLMKNALDAIEGSGSISLAVSSANDTVHIDVSDTGKGLGKGRFGTIFEPGFSTKRRGWGLGLSLSKRIVENYHNGRIFVKESTMGKGTTIRIVLPA